MPSSSNMIMTTTTKRWMGGAATAASLPPPYIGPNEGACQGQGWRGRNLKNMGDESCAVYFFFALNNNSRHFSCVAIF